LDYRACGCVVLHDHIIIGRNGHVSLKAQGLI
jgi:DNA repair protein RadC